MSRVWKESRSKGSELLLLLAIANYAKDDGSGAWPSITTLAADTRMTDRNVRFVIKRLEDRGELVVHRGAGPHGTNLYDIVLGVKSLHPEKSSGLKSSVSGGEAGFTPPLKRASPEPLLIRQEPSEMASRSFSDAEERVVRCVRRVRGAERIEPEAIVTHLRSILDELPVRPSDAAISEDAVRFRDHWNDERSSQPAEKPWRGWRRAMTNWFTRTRDASASRRTATIDEMDDDEVAAYLRGPIINGQPYGRTAD